MQPESVSMSPMMCVVQARNTASGIRCSPYPYQISPPCWAESRATPVKIAMPNPLPRCGWHAALVSVGRAIHS
jgi:hypothetical protein